MKKGRFLFLLISLTTSLAGFSQTRPSNDNLTNATVLTGTDLTFTGSLKGATLEDSADAAGDTWNTPTGSIWWSWTAPISTVLNLELQPFQPDGEEFTLDVLNVYAATNGITKPAGLLQPPLVSLPLVAGLANQWLSVPVSAGSNYFIQLVGNSSNYIYNFRLLATNAPLILKQPLNQTVYSNDYTLLYVVSAGLTPRTFQWLFNGTNLPGETAPILALTNIDSSMVGTYSVLVSSSNASVMSDPVTLSISPSNIPPVLTALGRSSNTLSFSLSGETGRAYHIQSSSNLVDWTPQDSFPIAPTLPAVYWYQLGDFVFTTNSPLTLNVPVTTSNKFFYRAAIVENQTHNSKICINNLRQITIAKMLWQLEAKTNLSSYATSNNISPFLSHWPSLVCPNDTMKMFSTSYDLQPFERWQAPPACQIDPTNHALDGVP